MDHTWIYFYQHLPYYVKPNLNFGFFSISWYSIMYLVSFVVVYILIKYRISRAEYESQKISNDKLQIPNKIQNQKSKWESLLLDFLLYTFIGLIIGARLGEVFFYNFSYYAAYPLQIISPFDPITHKFIGIYGMSYHGGLIGVIIAGAIFCRKFKVNFWQWTNFIIPAIPLGYFFGRLGNFINGELYGRVTAKWWGMYFPQSVQTQNFASLQLRHPSQVYEAVLEGLFLFFILWPMRNKKWVRDNMLALYLLGYAMARIICEFFREPEKPSDVLLGIITIGQTLSLAMLALALAIFWKNRKNLV